jgi:tetratricopeptide (TPR) repeat protein
MLKAKKKITKREIKEDWLVTASFRAQTFLDQNRKLISSVGVGVLIVIVAGWAYLNNQRERNENATTYLGNILRSFDESRYDIAINGIPQQNVRGLKWIVDEYGSTPSGEQAKLYLADCYMALGRHEEALRLFEDADLADRGLRATALAGAGACWEALGDYQKSSEYFERAYRVDDEGVLAHEYLYHAAANLARAGREERAKELMNLLKKEYPDSPRVRDAGVMLATGFAREPK